MKLEDTNSIYYINKEIAKIQEEINNLDNKNLYRRSNISEMPKGESETDIFTEYANYNKTLKDMLDYSLKKLQLKRREWEQFINEIEDDEMRLIIRMRVINNMKWDEIGAELQIDRTTASKKFKDFFKNT